VHGYWQQLCIGSLAAGVTGERHTTVVRH
jgi:hypothetical protein